MCSPGAAGHTGPGNPPKGTDHSIQEAFHQETRNNFMGWQEGIKNKPVCWNRGGFHKRCVCHWSWAPSGHCLPEMCSHHQIIWVLMCLLPKPLRPVRSPGEVLLALLIEDHSVLLVQSALRAVLAPLKGRQPSAAALLFLILVRRNRWVVLTTPKCGHAGISSLSSSVWKRPRSFPGQGGGLPPPHQPTFPAAGCWALKPEPCFSSTIQSGLGCEHLSILLTLCRCFQGSVCVIPLAGGAVVIMSRFGAGHRANENFLPLGFPASLQSLHPRSQGWGKLEEEFQCRGAVPRSAFCPFFVPWMVGLTPQPRPEIPLHEGNQDREIQNILKWVQRCSSAKATGQNRSNE